MNPFDYFQHLKPLIEADAQVMQNLRIYCSNDPEDLPHLNVLDLIARGTNNVHFRIGKVGDVWLATREDLSDFYWESDRSVCESYIGQAIVKHDEWYRVPRICGAVRAQSSEEERYFLLLEDLTGSGRSDLVPAPSGGVAGTLNGEPIYYDFDTLHDSALDETAPEGYWKYTKPEYVLHLDMR